MSNELEEDIRLAKKAVTSKDDKSIPTCFSDITGIYHGTTEMISKQAYQEALKDKKRILSVIASGDQIINSILFGSTDISGFDISRFPKYYLMLKLAAIKSLSKKQYLNFFFNQECEEVFKDGTRFVLKRNSKVFSEKLYLKLYPNLDKDAQVFWDSLFDSFSVDKLYNSSLFIASNSRLNKDEMCRANPYLDDENYKTVRDRLDNISIKLYQGNIFKLVNESMGKFDLVNLSNIIESCTKTDQETEEFKKLVESLPLTDRGIVLSYIQSFERQLEYGILRNFGDDYHKIGFAGGRLGFAPDGLLIYEKEKALRKTLKQE